MFTALSLSRPARRQENLQLQFTDIKAMNSKITNVRVNSDFFFWGRGGGGGIK